MDLIDRENNEKAALLVVVAIILVVAVLLVAAALLVVAIKSFSIEPEHKLSSCSLLQRQPISPPALNFIMNVEFLYLLTNN